MTQQLIASSNSTAVTLPNYIETLKISTYEGENVGEVITHSRSISQRLGNMRRCDVSGNEIDLIPLDLSKRDDEMIQTSFSAEFNSLFHTQYTHEYANSLIVGHSAWTDPDRILVLAQNLYIKLCADEKWIEVNQNQESFTTFSTPKAALASWGRLTVTIVEDLIFSEILKNLVIMKRSRLTKSA
jgi:hypothetical protein